MDTRHDLTPEESAEILSGMQSVPIPEGMARRAVMQWAEEQTTHRHVRSRLTLWWRPMVGAAAAVLLVAVMYRQGDVRSVAPESLSGRNGAPSIAGAVAPKVAERSTAPSPGSGASRKAIATTAPAPRTRMAAAPPRTKADRAAASLDRIAAKPAGDGARFETEIGVRAMVGSSADLAYLNGAIGEAAVPPEAPGAVPDTRLLNTVTLAEENLGVADLIGELRGRTGIEIALPDEAARESIAVYCTNKPLREVLRQMARALDLQWTRTGAGDASRYSAALRAERADMAEESAAPPAPMLAGAAGTAEASPQRSAKGEIADAQTRRMSGALRAEPDVSIIGDPERVRAVLGRARVGRAAPGAAVLPTEGWLILRKDR